MLESYDSMIALRSNGNQALFCVVKQVTQKLQSDTNHDYRIEIHRVIYDLKQHDLITEFESQKTKEGNRTPCFMDYQKYINSIFNNNLKPTAQRASSFVKDTNDIILKLRQIHHIS